MDGSAITEAASDYAGLQAAAEAYIVALNEGDVDALREMFLPEAHLYAARDSSKGDGSRMILPREDWLAAVAGRDKPSEQGFQPEGRVVMIDFINETTAVAKIECKVGTAAFTDYLNYLKIDGAWKVVAKVFHRHN